MAVCQAVGKELLEAEIPVPPKSVRQPEFLKPITDQPLDLMLAGSRWKTSLMEMLLNLESQLALSSVLCLANQDGGC